MKTTTRNPKQRGFTLIELMITVAIVGILAAIAYPSYLKQVRKSRRTDAVSLLVQAANRQERYYTTQYEYASTMAKLGLDSATENGWYSVTIKNADAKGFDLVATAQQDQTEDECYTYGLNQLGEKTAANGSGGDVTSRCW